MRRHLVYPFLLRRLVLVLGSKGLHHLGSSLNLKTVSHFWHDFSLSSQKLTSPPRNPSVITCQIRRASETPLTCELYDAIQTIKHLLYTSSSHSGLKSKNKCNLEKPPCLHQRQKSMGFFKIRMMSLYLLHLLHYFYRYF